MIKTVAKLGIWLVVGIGSTIALLGHTNLQTSWEYTVESNIPAGTEITVIKSDDELVKISLPEDQAISKTFDVGAPLTLIGAYLLGSIIAFGLKGRRRIGRLGPEIAPSSNLTYL